MMRRKTVLTALLAMILLMTACGRIGGGGGDDAGRGEYATGYGLELDFVNSMPPDLVQLESKFPIGVEIRNAGSEGIQDGLLTLVNYYHNFIEIEDKTTYDIGRDRVFEGSSEYNRMGDYELVVFKAEAVKSTSESEEVLFKAKACYPYETRASPTLCMNTNKYSFLQAFTQVCTVGDVRVPIQGAPLQVTKVEEKIFDLDEATSTLQLIIHLKNIGLGKVTTRTSYKKECEGKAIAENELNDIDLMIHFSDMDLDRSSCHKPTINENDLTEMTIFCTTTINKARSAYTTPISIILRYGYVTADEFKRIRILADLDNLPCKGYCKDSCQGFGGEAPGSCTEEKECCSLNEPVCNRYTDLGYGCHPEAVCEPDMTKWDYYDELCPAGDQCCVPKELSCPRENCRPEVECVYGYGGVNELAGGCPEGEKCCMSADTCYELGDYRCFRDWQTGYDTCKGFKPNYCPIEEKCCQKDADQYEKSCKEQGGNCIDTISCEGFGGEVKGSCFKDQVCCKEREPECKRKWVGDYSSRVLYGVYTCISSGEKDQCEPGTGEEGLCKDDEVCCKIKSRCQNDHQGKYSPITAPGLYACTDDTDDCEEDTTEEGKCAAGKTCCKVKPACDHPNLGCHDRIQCLPGTEKDEYYCAGDDACCMKIPQ
ncbi:MAG: hypothetical protein KJ709_07440 [Nanoarchaeota archaeon]|nr:hypothetical protein [Nanoarchaeota archaeon]